MFRDLPGRLLAPVPLPLLQPLMTRLVRRATGQRPELFRRLGSQKDKRYLIDPVNMPFVFLLCPDPARPSLRLYRRSVDLPLYDARIAGTFLTLLDMVDGKTDGDALFFSRDLIIEGDTEAVVVLRNALDDLDGRITDDLAAFFGPPGRMALSMLRKISSARGESRHAPF
jgi:predicted lipid carrier protein YhbT